MRRMISLKYWHVHGYSTAYAADFWQLLCQFRSSDCKICVKFIFHFGFSCKYFKHQFNFIRTFGLIRTKLCKKLLWFDSGYKLEKLGTLIKSCSVSIKIMPSWHFENSTERFWEIFNQKDHYFYLICSIWTIWASFCFRKYFNWISRQEPQIDLWIHRRCIIINGTCHIRREWPERLIGLLAWRLV